MEEASHTTAWALTENQKVEIEDALDKSKDLTKLENPDGAILAFFDIDSVGEAILASAFTVAEEMDLLVSIAREDDDARVRLSAMDAIRKRLENSLRLSGKITQITGKIEREKDGVHAQVVAEEMLLAKNAHKTAIDFLDTVKRTDGSTTTNTINGAGKNQVKFVASKRADDERAQCDEHAARDVRLHGGEDNPRTVSSRTVTTEESKPGDTSGESEETCRTSQNQNQNHGQGQSPSPSPNGRINRIAEFIKGPQGGT